MLRSINPANGELIATYEAHTETEVEQKLIASEKAYRAGRSDTLSQRAVRLSKAADILESRKEELARLMTAEMGKPITQARAEVEKCALVCRYYAEEGETFLADEHLESDKGESYIRYLPLGPILAVMPWNYPFWQVFRFAAPNLMVGNTALLKHASNVTGCALAIEDIFKDASFAEASFQTLKLPSDRIEGVIKSPQVRGVTLTGSEQAGSAVAAIAGREIKKTVLELGGSDAFIVMPSAHLQGAIETGVKARLQNNGQSCIAAKRFIVHADIYDEFRSGFLDALAAKNVGDPMLDDTDVGPLVSTDAVETLAEQVSKSCALGAKQTAPAFTPPGGGAWFAPSILEDIPSQSPAAQDEFFGPVALFFPVRSLREAIDRANDHRYGLGSSVWTQDSDEIDMAVDQIEAGSTYVNQMVASDPKLPFGGVKKSGYGRELSKAGMQEFTNRKTIAVK